MTSFESLSMRFKHASVLTPVEPSPVSAKPPRTNQCEAEHTVNVHGARSADSLTARATERKGRVELVLDLENGVEDHRAALVQVDLVLLQVGLLRRLVRVLRGVGGTVEMSARVSCVGKGVARRPELPCPASRASSPPNLLPRVPPSAELEMPQSYPPLALVPLPLLHSLQVCRSVNRKGGSPSGRP